MCVPSVVIPLGFVFFSFVLSLKLPFAPMGAGFWLNLVRVAAFSYL